MQRIDRILKHPLYRSYLLENEKAEADRLFCHHDMGHFLDVARIGRILNLEENLGCDPELIYAAALLHDIGRHLQYRDGTPHEAASAKLSLRILEDCGFDREEENQVLEAILSHRDKTVAGEKSLRGVLYRADKLSRACYACRMESECDWKKEKKNLELRY